MKAARSISPLFFVLCFFPSIHNVYRKFASDSAKMRRLSGRFDNGNGRNRGRGNLAACGQRSQPRCRRSGIYFARPRRAPHERRYGTRSFTRAGGFNRNLEFCDAARQQRIFSGFGGRAGRKPGTRAVRIASSRTHIGARICSLINEFFGNRQFSIGS